MTAVAGQAFSILVDSKHLLPEASPFASSFTAVGLTVNGNGLASAATVYFYGRLDRRMVTTLTLTGAANKYVTLRSTTTGLLLEYLNNTGTSSATFVNAEDSNAGQGNTILANDGTSLSAGNNVNWQFANTCQTVNSVINGSWSSTSTWDGVDLSLPPATRSM